MRSFIPLLAVLAATASAKTVVINVGQSGLTFSPDTNTADVGDMLEFHFFGSIHSAVSGDFATPCQMSASGFDSGTINNQADGSGSVFQVMVTDTNPIWFFCGTPGHCQSGMAGVVNAPSSGDSLASYKSSAAGTSTQASGKVQGGVVVAVPNGGSSSSSPPSSSSSASASSPPPSSASISATTASSSSVSVTSTASSSIASSGSSSASSAPPTSSAQSSASNSTGVSTSQSVGVSTSTTLSSTTSPTSIAKSGAERVVGRSGVLCALVVGVGILVGAL